MQKDVSEKVRYLHVIAPKEDKGRFFFNNLNNFFLLQFWSSNTSSLVFFVSLWSNWEKKRSDTKCWRYKWYFYFKNKYTHTQNECIYFCSHKQHLTDKLGHSYREQKALLWHALQPFVERYRKDKRVQKIKNILDVFKKRIVGKKQPIFKLCCYQFNSSFRLKE